MDVHARIRAFTQGQTVTPLMGDTAPFPDAHYLKAGIVPYIVSGLNIEYLMMKPVSKRSSLAPPSLQICKGTRMYLHRGSGWRDMRPGDEMVEGKESLFETALREGVEEVGLMPEAVRSVQDVGPYKFVSERTSRNKYMWLFTVRLDTPLALLPDAEVAATTAQRSWVGLDEFEAVGRHDHGAILQDIESKLRRHLGLRHETA
jgi:hypothetical protein